MRPSLIAICALLSLLVSGCARMPAVLPEVTAPTRQLRVEFTLAAPVNPAYHYFVAIDANADPADGPVPIVANPAAPIPATGVPLIISDSPRPPEFYLHYRQGAFFQYRNLNYIGPPYQAGVSADGLTIAAIMDLDQITTTAAHIELNIITADRLLPPDSTFIELEYDGLGPAGNTYLIVPVDVSGTYTNAEAVIPELTGDTPIAALDIADWTVEVRLTR